MKVSDFEKTVRDTPAYYPVFTVERVPEWAGKYVKKGDLVYWLPIDVFVVINTGQNIGFGPSAVKFKEYWTSEEIIQYRNKVFEE